MQVKDHMRFNIITVDKDLKIIDLIKIYRTVSLKSRLSYVVDKKYKLYGVISMYDIVNLLCTNELQIKWLEEADDEHRSEIFESIYRHRLDINVCEIMQTSFLSVKPDEELMSACRVIQDNKVTAVPVIDEKGVLLGEISRRTMLEYLTDLVLEPQQDVMQQFFPCI
ncbi:CBS domain-containing protein [Maridesulfovibrio bastinii]|jgi:predicted transcriptional regulator|uniref:CBS domain-containing protein n=1 Tax=Maridesulfovibrio bastinii TaxID=47157 RepID=UPI0004065B01|nr:CBS domain-containing protein [Maridesulfovibrio bastinii]